MLGLAGCPRRIPDYPDSFAGWNAIASYGSMVSLVATFLFLYILFDQLTSKTQVSPNPWAVPAFFDSNLPITPTLSAPTLEWLLSSPPAFHHYNELPVATESSPNSPHFEAASTRQSTPLREFSPAVAVAVPGGCTPASQPPPPPPATVAPLSRVTAVRVFCTISVFFLYNF